MMPDPSVTHAYLGYFRCGHMNYMAVDDPNPEERESLGQDLADIVKAGGHVTRVLLQEARDTHLGCPDECPLSWKNQKEAAEKAAREEETKRDIKPVRARAARK
jgi:hypothetical protein